MPFGPSYPQPALNFPRDLAEYVIVHELVHLLAPNHGKLFKSFLLAYLPDWQARDQALRALTPPTKDDHPS